MGAEQQHGTSYNYPKAKGMVWLQQPLQCRLLICSTAHLSLRGKQPCVPANTGSDSEVAVIALTLQLMPECSQCQTYLTK